MAHTLSASVRLAMGGLAGVILGFMAPAAAQQPMPGASPALPAPSAGAVSGRPVLAPHRAVYDLVLDPGRPSRAVTAARGRLAFDFTGDACEGYALSFRQVVELESDSGARRIDVRTTNFEAGDASLFRFRSETRAGERVVDTTDGTVEREGEGFRARMSKPKPATFDFGSDVVFPSEHLKRIIAAARGGATTLSVRVYDGSEEGAQVYDTLAVIGRRLAPGSLAGLEEAVQAPGLDDQARWPVSVSYFKSGKGEVTPSYALGFDLFENGVTRKLVLDYRDFRMVGKLVKLDLQKPGACAK